MTLGSTDYRTTQVISFNNWYSPISTAKQPTYYDFWSQNYEKYVATGAKLTIKFINASTAIPMTVGIV